MRAYHIHIKVELKKFQKVLYKLNMYDTMRAVKKNKKKGGS
ncbi:hypothetical protein ALPS_255 [Bacillus phage ALPS]|nr:hypothetical protein ALPS_255 [Bacillus phage ALPS]